MCPTPLSLQYEFEASSIAPFHSRPALSRSCALRAIARAIYGRRRESRSRRSAERSAMTGNAPRNRSAHALDVHWHERAALRVGEVARLLGIDPATVRRLIRRGDLPVARIGRIMLVPTEALRETLGECSPPRAARPSRPLRGPGVRTRASRIVDELCRPTAGRGS